MSAPTDTKTRLLVVEQDGAVRKFLADNLAADGFDTEVAHDAASAIARMRDVPDLVVADLNGQTLGLVDEIRNADERAERIDPRTPVIVLSTRADELTRVRALERGGDDFVAKPFSYPELRARVRCVLRRTYQLPTTPRVSYGPLEVDPASRDVRVDGKPVELTAKEWELLRALLNEPTRVFTKAELLRSVWAGAYTHGHTRTLDSHATRLRQKLRAPTGRDLVVNVWGVGYRLATSAPEAVTA